jgi:galactokinase/mevalonate kinase-like predicted kinase
LSAALTTFPLMILPLTSTDTLALAQAVQRNRALYERLRRRRTPRLADYLVLTVSDGRQAATCRKEIAERQRRGFFPPGWRALVVADPEDRRIGTGGATVRALRVVAHDIRQHDIKRVKKTRNAVALLRGRRVLVVHGGGRDGAFGREAAAGKPFVKLPALSVDGEPSTLFDELFVLLACVIERLGPALLVASGDVLLVFDAGAVCPVADGVTGFAAATAAEQGAHHGVYAVGRRGTIRTFLHKADERVLLAAGAEDALGRVWVDTGMVAFAGRGLEMMTRLGGLPALAEAGGHLNLYDDVVPTLPNEANLAAYLYRAHERRAVREQVWSAFHGLPFRAQKLSPAVFVHLGSVADHREAVASDGPVGAIYGLLRKLPARRRGSEDAELAEVREQLAAGAPAAEIVARFIWPGQAVRLSRSLEHLATRSEPLFRTRVHSLRTHLLNAAVARSESVSSALRLRRQADHAEEAAFAAVHEAIAVEDDGAQSSAQATLALKPGAELTVELPVRLDFGGGWSDTPPHSLERGGTVLNAAVLLEGLRPVRATVRALPEQKIRLHALDLGTDLVARGKAEILAYRDPGDPFALHKAALVLAGIVPPGRESLETCLRRFGCGVEITTESRVPKGSGLGTSSILGACLVLALCRLCGQDARPVTLFEKVLHLEQMLTTGGGWQDQVGGLVPGIKLITSGPGVPQRLKVEPVKLPAAVSESLHQRLVLVYVGHRRLAKNILRTVMGRYLAREADVVFILRRIQEVAREMRRSLLVGDLDGFGKLMLEHWELNKRLDPNSTNRHVEVVLAAAAPWASGYKMVGAGGGGFAEIIARGPREARRIERDVVAAGGQAYRWALATQTL